MRHLVHLPAPEPPPPFYVSSVLASSSLFPVLLGLPLALFALHLLLILHPFLFSSAMSLLKVALGTAAPSSTKSKASIQSRPQSQTSKTKRGGRGKGARSFNNNHTRSHAAPPTTSALSSSFSISSSSTGAIPPASNITKSSRSSPPFLSLSNATYKHLSSSSSSTQSSPSMSSYPSSPTTSLAETLVEESPKATGTMMRQATEAFLVLDVEATCMQGTSFDYPNEIIEFPVVLLKWADRDATTGRASTLIKVDEFRSYVRPTWRPALTDFCTALTGITQGDVALAPTWPEVLRSFDAWLASHGLLPHSTDLFASLPAQNPTTTNSPPQDDDARSSQTVSSSSTTKGNRKHKGGKKSRASQSIDAKSEKDKALAEGMQKFVFCTDGPYDVRDFVVKQCFISQIPVPWYFQVDILDVRKSVTTHIAFRNSDKQMLSTATRPPGSSYKKGPGAVSPHMNIHAQLRAMGLAPFEGRHHSGIDDARNIARVLIGLSALPLRLEANTFIHPGRKWHWMTRDGGIDWPETFTPYSGEQYGSFGVTEYERHASASPFGGRGRQGVDSRNSYRESSPVSRDEYPPTPVFAPAAKRPFFHEYGSSGSGSSLVFTPPPGPPPHPHPSQSPEPWSSGASSGTAFSDSGSPRLGQAQGALGMQQMHGPHQQHQMHPAWSGHPGAMMSPNEYGGMHLPYPSGTPPPSFQYHTHSPSSHHSTPEHIYASPHYYHHHPHPHHQYGFPQHNAPHPDSLPPQQEGEFSAFDTRFQGLNIGPKLSAALAIVAPPPTVTAVRSASPPVVISSPSPTLALS